MIRYLALFIKNIRVISDISYNNGKNSDRNPVSAVPLRLSENEIPAFWLLRQVTGKEYREETLTESRRRGVHGAVIRFFTLFLRNSILNSYQWIVHVLTVHSCSSQKRSFISSATFCKCEHTRWSDNEVLPINSQL